MRTVQACAREAESKFGREGQTRPKWSDSMLVGHAACASPALSARFMAGRCAHARWYGSSSGPVPFT